MRSATEALIAVDIQNDFCPGGALAVTEGDTIVPIVNALISEFPTLILTQDWHPPQHQSFAANHPGASAYDTVQMPYGPQTLWPVHCVQGTEGAAFHPDLNVDAAQLVIRKGFNPAIDSYSALFENDHKTATGLEGYLRSRGIQRLTFTGLATDFCVGFSALDAARLGFEVAVRLDACRGIDLNGSMSAMLERMRAANVTLEG